jgi:hypothetical protein
MKSLCPGGITLFIPIVQNPRFAIQFTAVKQTVFPHFDMLSDNSIAALFLKTVAANPEDAWAYVSRHYAGTLDLDALHDVLGNSVNHLCSCPVHVTYEAKPKNYRTRSVLVMDAEYKVKRLLHLHMVKEPDNYGQWKVYGVEQE